MHDCIECGKPCECWDGDELGLEYCTHDSKPTCEVRDDLRDDLEFEDAHDDYADWWDEE